MPKMVKFSIIPTCFFLLGSPSSILDMMLGSVISFLRVGNFMDSIFSEKSLSYEISCPSSFGSSFLELILAEH